MGIVGRLREQTNYTPHRRASGLKIWRATSEPRHHKQPLRGAFSSSNNARTLKEIIRKQLRSEQYQFTLIRDQDKFHIVRRTGMLIRI